MKRTMVRSLSDQELRPELEAGDTILFVSTSIDWVDIERQVERLGFGESYLVCATQARGSAIPTITVKPFTAAAA